MLNKFALGGLLLTSSLALTSAAMAGFEDNGDTLNISVRKLQSGSKYGEIYVQGKKCTVSNLTPALWSSLQDLKKDDKLTASKNQGSFYFSHTQGGGFETKYNEETKQWEPDFEKPLPGMTIFNLKLTPLSEKPTVETIENNTNVVSLTTTLSSLKIDQEIKEEKPSISSSVTISPVELVEFDYGRNLVLTAEQLEKGFLEGKLVTNHGTFSVAPSHQYASNTFTMIWDKKQKFTGYVSGGQFHFSHMEGGYEMKYNEETKEWELDYTRPTPGIEIFNLVVKKMDN